MDREFAHLANSSQANFCLFGSGAFLPNRQRRVMANENSIRSLREERELTLEQLADLVGLSVPYVSRLEKGERNLAVKHIDKFAAALGVPRERILTIADKAPAAGVPVVGLAGAGPDASVLFGSGQGTADTAPAPPTWTPTTVALEVRGNSMRGIAFDGWFVYYDSTRGQITEDMIGQPCVIGLPDERVVVKIPFFGRKAGTFDLESSNQTIDTMRDQRVEWASIVTAIVPRNPARKLPDRSSNEASV